MKPSSRDRRSISPEDFADRFCTLMQHLMRKMTAQERNYFARGLITLPQVRALQLLAETGSCTMRHIAHTLGLTCSTVTGLVDRLEKLALARRIDSSEDRRVVLAAITPKGKRILDHIRREKRKAIMDIFSSATAQERLAHVQVLEKMLARMSVRGQAVGRIGRRADG